MKKLLRSLFILALSPLALCASELTWHTDMQAAKTEAKESGKPLMTLFTGSDWCAWCMRLENEVLSQEAFSEKVADKFVFVLVDKPKKNPLPAAQAAANAALFNKYQVSSVPTVMIMDTDGNSIGSTGFRDGGPVAYAEFLLEMSQTGD